MPGFEDFDDYYEASLTLNQVIYQAEARYGLRAARLAYGRAQMGSNLAQIGLTYAVKAAYAGVLLQEAFDEVARESVDLARKALSDTRAHRRAGTVTDLEVLQAEVRLRNAEAARLKTRTAVRLARAAFLRRIEFDQGESVELTDELTYDPVPLRPLSEVRQEAEALRVEVQMLDASIRLQELAVAVATAGRQPSLAFSGSYSGASNKDYFHEDFLFDWRAGVYVKIPIFDGLQARGRHRMASAELAKLELRRESLLQDIEYELRSAVARVENARESVESQGESVRLARRAHEQASARYENGLVTELVVEEARVGLARSRSNYVGAMFEHFMAMLDLEKAAGILEVPRPLKEEAQ
jgi:outer membrane protein TolC